MNRLLTFHHTKGLLPHLVKNEYFANLPKVLVGGFFDTFSNHSINSSIFIGTKRSLYTSSNSFPKFYNKRSISTNGPSKDDLLKLPTNREEEVNYLEDFRSANHSVKIRALIDLQRATKSRNYSFSRQFCREICDILSEWISTQKRMHVVNTLIVLHLHQYLDVPVNSSFSRKIGIWIQSGELSKMTYDKYFGFVSALPYLPSLKLNKEQLTLLASAGKKYIEMPESKNYYLVTFIWCFTNMNESIKLSQLCPEVFQLWFNVTLPRIPQLTEKECNQCIVALGKEGQLPPLEWREEMTKRLLTFKTFVQQHCSNITMSIAKLPDLIPNDSDRKTLLKKLLRIYHGHAQKNGQTHPQHLSNICCGLSNLHKSNIIDFKPPKSFLDTLFNAKFVGKFNDEAVHQMVDSMFEFGIENPPNNFLEELFRDFKSTKPHTAGLILYGICKTNYRCNIPEHVIRDCFKVWYDGIAYRPFEQLTFPRYALCEMYSVFKLKPTDIIPEFGPHFWKEIELRLDQNEVERAKNIFYLLKAHFVFNDVPIHLLNRLLMLTKVVKSAETAANMLWLYGRLSEYKEVEIPNESFRHNFDVWFVGLDSLNEGHAVFGVWGLHCHNISPETIIPNFWSLYWKKIEKKSFNEESRNMLRSSVQNFANEIPEDLVTKFKDK